MEAALAVVVVGMAFAAVIGLVYLASGGGPSGTRLMVCTRCHCVHRENHVSKTSGRITFSTSGRMWGSSYSGQLHLECPSCECRAVIPIESPRARQMLGSRVDYYLASDVSPSSPASKSFPNPGKPWETQRNSWQKCSTLEQNAGHNQAGSSQELVETDECTLEAIAAKVREMSTRAAAAGYPPPEEVNYSDPESIVGEFQRLRGVVSELERIQSQPRSEPQHENGPRCHKNYGQW